MEAGDGHGHANITKLGLCTRHPCWKKAAKWELATEDHDVHTAYAHNHDSNGLVHKIAMLNESEWTMALGEVADSAWSACKRNRCKHRASA